jgi:hypothetical protein
MGTARDDRTRSRRRRGIGFQLTGNQQAGGRIGVPKRVVGILLVVFADPGFRVLHHAIGEASGRYTETFRYNDWLE